MKLAEQRSFSRGIIKKAINRLKRGLGRINRRLGTERSLLLKLVDDHTQFGGSSELACLKGRQTALSSPLLYDKELSVIRQPAITAAVPDVHLLELRSVAAFGATMAVIRNNQLLHPELLHTTPIYDDKAPDIYRFADAGRRSLQLKAHSRFVGKRRIAAGIHLLKEHSWNYYHWLFECLPRLVFVMDRVKNLGDVSDLTILIDAGVSTQCVEALEYLVRDHDLDCKLLKVGRGEQVFCDRLFYVSPFWYSLDNSRHPADPHKDFVVDKEAVELTKNAFQRLMSSKVPSRKIYLPRTVNQVRRILNVNEVEDLVSSFGFETIHPIGFSFREQIELFSSASIVIGATGAAFSNIVFMQPGTKSVIFSPNHLKVFNYYLFQQLADVAQVELAHLLTIPAEKENFRVHDDFYVNCDDLGTLLQQLSCNEAGRCARCA